MTFEVPPPCEVCGEPALAFIASQGCPHYFCIEHITEFIINKEKEKDDQ